MDQYAPSWKATNRAAIPDRGPNRETASTAYSWSLATVEAIVNVEGMVSVERILDRIAAESATEDALHAVLHASYGDLMQSTVQYLRKAYL